MRTDFQHLLVQQDGGVLTITMNRPEVLNAFNDVMLEELTEAVEAASRDEAVRCVVLTGAGRAFGSGSLGHRARREVNANRRSVRLLVARHARSQGSRKGPASDCEAV